jgi:predicted ArsR family transcriptional regulator
VIEPEAARARALADPTRYALYRCIVDSREPVSVAELTRRVRVHHNAVRRHLATLRDAGLVHEAREARDRPGRPRLLYRAAEPGRDPYETLAMLLLDVVVHRRSPRDTGRDAGFRDTGRDAWFLDASAEDAPAEPLDALEAAAARAGFSPQRVLGTDGHEELVLRHCPIAAAAAADPGTVCEIHRGIAEGVVDALGTEATVQLVPCDPVAGGCRLRVTAPAAPPIDPAEHA